jgi:hypothetical protein
VAAKKKLKKFSVVKAVKEAAREQVGTPPATRAVPDLKTRTKRREEKHKKTIADLLESSSE